MTPRHAQLQQGVDVLDERLWHLGGVIEDAIEASIRDVGGILVYPASLTRDDDDSINTSSGAGFSSAAGRSQG
jgi:hypothetical protein